MTAAPSFSRALPTFFRRNREQSGSSLVELMVVTVLLSVVIGVALSGLVSAQNADQGNAERVGNLDQARLLIDNTGRDLRTAVRLQAGGQTFSIAGPREVLFTATLDTTAAPVEVHLYIDASSQLIEQTTPPNGGVAPAYTYPALGSPLWKTRYVARFINNTPSQPIFNFCDASATACTPTTPNIPFPITAGVPQPLPATGLNSRLSIHAVVLYFSVRHSTVFTVNASVLTTRVRLPNLDYNGLGGL